jgi:hypothetical protein
VSPGAGKLGLRQGSCRRTRRRPTGILPYAAQPMMMDEDTDVGLKAFPRTDFKSGIPTYVTGQVNTELQDLGYSTVKRSDYDVAHKVSFDVPRSDAISEAWETSGSMLFDSKGRPRSSQVTSFFNLDS